MIFAIWIEYVFLMSDRHDFWANIFKILLSIFILWGFYGAYRRIKFPDTLELSAEKITHISKISNKNDSFLWKVIVKIEK